VTKIITIIDANMVTPTVVAKRELLFNRLNSEDGLLNIFVELKEHNKVRLNLSILLL